MPDEKKYVQCYRCGAQHALDEMGFAGLMNEYIKLCFVSLAAMDFMQARVHTGKVLPMQRHHAAYLGEKFGCIFGPTFQAQPELWKVFVEQVMGMEQQPDEVSDE